MFRFFQYFLTRTPKQPRMPLGRWNLKDDPDVKSLFANYDHCGDKICKDPTELVRHTRDFPNKKMLSKRVNT